MSRQIDEISDNGIILDDGQALTWPELSNIMRSVGEALKKGEIKVDDCRYGDFFAEASSRVLQEIGRQGVVVRQNGAKTINDLCERYGEYQGIKDWGLLRIDEFLDALRKSPVSRTKVPRRIRHGATTGLYDKLMWLTDDCEPQISVDRLEAYFIDCMQP